MKVKHKALLPYRPDGSSHPPADGCLFCGRSIDSTKERRIIAQQERGILLRPNPKEGTIEAAEIPIPLPDGSMLFMQYWGEETLWTTETVECAKQIVLSGKHPWFCQICGDRACRTCGKPLLYPVGSDVIHDDGDIRHVPIWPFPVGCSNGNCSLSEERIAKKRR